MFRDKILGIGGLAGLFAGTRGKTSSGLARPCRAYFTELGTPCVGDLRCAGGDAFGGWRERPGFESLCVFGVVPFVWLGAG